MPLHHGHLGCISTDRTPLRKRSNSASARIVVSVLAASACIGACVGAVSASAIGGRASQSHSGIWQTAVPVPNIIALNKGLYTELDDEVCSSQGNCSAGGEYRPVAHSTRMSSFVVSDVNGKWGAAKEVPGLAALDTGDYAQLHAVACASAGNCVAGGGYREASGNFEAYLVNQIHGAWHNAFEVSGISALNTGGTSYVQTISCGAVGDCSAGGSYVDSSGHSQAFVVDESHGVWGQAIEVPGTAVLNIDGNATVDSISCTAPGSCTAGGGYKDGAAHFEAFVDDEVHGTWGTAVEVPGTQSLNAGDQAAVTVVTCTSAANCTAGGDYRDAAFHTQIFIDTETAGTWGTAIEAPGSGILNVGGIAYFYALSCSTAGNCVGGGSYLDRKKLIQSYLIDEVHGVWQRAFEVPGTAALNVQGGGEGVSAISCIAPGTCAVGGDYQDDRGGSPIYVINEVNGVWGRAEELPGSGALNTGDSATIFAVSCVRTGWCSAGGNYLKLNVGFEDFVSDYFASPVVTAIGPHAGPARGGSVVLVHGLHLEGATAVLFGATRTKRFGVVNGDEIRVTVPPGDGRVPVRVVTPGGVSAAVASGWFSYEHP